MKAALELANELDLVARSHVQLPDTKSIAIYSSCENYRYFLEREWSGGGRFLTMLMLNPSTATEYQNDPTLQRCETRARAGGFDGFRVLNIFALRSTDPKGLYDVEEPIGEHNDRFINVALQDHGESSQFICGWGNHGSLLNRSNEVRSLIEGQGVGYLALGWTASGEPKHPLYLSYDTEPSLWKPQE